jgi:predicted PurR-regulated permease PerM
VQAERERVVQFRPRTVFLVLAIIIGVAIVLEVLWIARHVLAWVFIALFLTLALNPAVDQVEARWIRRRGLATGVVYVVTLAAIAAIGALFIPTLVDQVNSFANNVPDYLNDITKGRGRLGFLQTKYHLVDKAREQLHNGGAKKLFGLSGTAVAVTKGVITAVVGALTIVFARFLQPRQVATD